MSNAGEKGGALGVLLDGEAMPESDARAFWSRFSTWMDDHKGDLKGFAASEGLASVHPTMQGGRAVLVASKSAPQAAYTSAREVKTPKTPVKGANVKSGLRAPGRPSGNASGGSSPNRSGNAGKGSGQTPKTGGGSSAPQRSGPSDAHRHGMNGQGPKGPKK